MSHNAENLMIQVENYVMGISGRNPQSRTDSKLNLTTDDRQIFTEEVRRYGWERLADGTFTTFGTILKQIADDARARITGFRTGQHGTHPMPEVVFDYTDDPQINAAAISATRRLLIALSVGLPIVLHYATLGMLSRPDMLNEIGDCTHEKTPSVSIPIMPNAAALVERVARAGLTMSVFTPRDKEREIAGRVLARLAVDFVIAHEFRHLQANHAAYQVGLTGQNLIQELNGRADSAEFALVSQAFEMDADSYALSTLLRNAFEVVAHPTNFPQGLRHIFSSESRALFMCVLAALILFKILELESDETIGWEARTHPPPAVRLQMMLATTQECIEQWKQTDLSDWFRDNIGRLLIIAEVEFAHMSSAVPNVTMISRATGEEGLQHIAKILETWARIEPELDKYSYVRLGKRTLPIT